MADQGHVWLRQRRRYGMRKQLELKAKLCPGPCRHQHRHDRGDTGLSQGPNPRCGGAPALSHTGF